MFSNIFRGLVLVAFSAGLSGCLTEDKIASDAAILKSNPLVLKQMIAECTTYRHLWSAESQIGLATIVSAADARNRPLICARIFNGIASGRLKAKDYNSFGDEVLTPNAIRILQGK